MIVYRDRDGGDILAAVLIFIVFSIAIAMLAIYLGSIILGIFLGVGVFLGFLYSIVVYIRAIVKVGATFTCPRGKNWLTNLLLRWLFLFLQVSKTAIVDNFTVARGALSKFLSYRFLSFRKWMWLIVVPTTMVFGLAVVIISLLIQAYVFIQLLSLSLTVVVAILLVEFLIGVFLSIIKIIPVVINAISGNNVFTYIDFSRGTGFLGTKNYIINFYKIFKLLLGEIWSETISTNKSNFGYAKHYSILGFKRSFYYMVAVSLYLITVVMTIILVIVYLVMFIVTTLIQFIWSILSLIFR